jgi:dipeptidase
MSIRSATRLVESIAVLASLLVFASLGASACTTLLVGSAATTDGSTFVTYSCDGGIFAALRIQPAEDHAPGSTVTIYADPQFYDPAAPPAVVALGSIPQVLHTFRYLDALAGPTYTHVGGMNEHGVSISETTLVAARPELSNPRGLLAPFSACPERSLMTLALQRARTAREAILVIGSLAETYGYSSPFPIDGEQLAISDGIEVWSMEIFGPGAAWRAGCGEPGAVWCAQRVPDGHVGISANRSRIGEIDLADSEQFLASPNATSLARRMGWWDPDRDGPFVWCAAYAPGAPEGSLLREWRVFDLVAPSLDLSPDGPLPFSAAPDRPLATADVMAIQRDLLEGTPFDVTAASAFSIGGSTSPLACPMCSQTLYALLGLEPERTINSRRSSFSALYQTRSHAPDALRGCAWYGFGPAATSCYVPIYTGATALPSAWGSTDLAHGDLSLPFWTMILPGYLAAAQWQSAFPDIRSLRGPAESAFLEEQLELSTRVTEWEIDDEPVATRLNAYTADRLNAVSDGFRDLSTRLLIDYVVELGAFLPGLVPTIGLPPLP